MTDRHRQPAHIFAATLRGVDGSRETPRRCGGSVDSMVRIRLHFDDAKLSG
jgi:hypothetical protein